jgi:hypothetical protein
MDPDRLCLLQRKFGDLLSWQRPELVETVGPFDPSVFTSYDDEHQSVLQRCEALLRRYTDDQIRAIIAQRGPEREAFHWEWHSFAEDDIKRLTKRRPPWFAGGFGHPDYKADFEYWCKMPDFTVDEILCLSIGISPEHFESDTLDKLEKRSFEDLWPSLQFLILRRRQLSRNFGVSIRRRPVLPEPFLKWIERVEFEVHFELVSFLRRYLPVTEGSRALGDMVAKPDKREIKSIAQLFTAMAIDCYGYCPDDAKSPTTREIVDMAAAIGLTISEDTVRKYLKMGAELIPTDWKPNRRKSTSE